MFFFQTALAEAAVEFDDLAFIDRLWRDWSPGYVLPDAERAALKETLRAPGVVTQILNYYRQLFTPPTDETAQALQARASGALTVPSLYFHGADDNCISVKLSDNMNAAFTSTFERIVVPDAGHFLHLEQPKTVAKHIVGFLNS
ncbi:alpha/beta fold hydrolase [Streptomyces sp. bgisy034]|uniref:alpha/beta fold hydrolase n=1 Tax=Streptomyces sp. bgisy034 TaxID=3413774 RepID=UPI003EB94B26